MKKTFFKLSILSVSMLAFMSTAHAVSPINLMYQPVSSLTAFVSGAADTKIYEISRSVDFKKTLHVRIQETYQGYKIWGADAIIHIPQGVNIGKSLGDVLGVAVANKGYMNGILYQNLNQDLVDTPAVIFEKAQAQKALEHAIDTYKHNIGAQPEVKNQQSELMVFIDDNKKAHWAFKVSFDAAPIKVGALPARPVVIMDAMSFSTYMQWNDIKTAEVGGGGNGGNKKMGKLVYDGNKTHLAKLIVTRDNAKQLCELKNSEVTVTSEKTDKVISYDCKKLSPTHKVYWNGTLGAVNNGYSPGNDALFGGGVIKHMYQDWYKIPVLVNKDGSPMMLNMVVNSYMDNAYWDGSRMVFGDGIDMFYPLTSIGVAAHEVSHGFTEQHSNLTYGGESGGMNEAFSDMAAQAAEVYAYGVGKNSWQIGPEIFKAPNEALRYMDQPSKDCGNRKPGDWCSIDDASQYEDGIDVHFSSGVYNRFFYNLGTAHGWTVKKAFDVMVDANSHYWTSSSTFSSGACGVLQAAKDMGEDLTAVKSAFDVVKVSYSDCKIVE